ncbi:MAG: hypothetical protein K8F91_03815 [Candidatus Obscuribacterales bacterium]|nr:hypothetical protein [Candidatus Obscuribacterales bacterium]
MTETDNQKNNALKKRKGMAIKGMKAYIKALEMAEGTRQSRSAYRYEINADGVNARILLSADGTTVDGTERSLTDWAVIGTPARLALIALRYTKDKLDQPGQPVFYTLNVITGDANITFNGEVMTSDDNGNPLPSTFKDWAELGKPIERREFESLRAAKEYRNEDAIALVEKNMIRWGIIRAPKETSTTTS